MFYFVQPLVWLRNPNRLPSGEVGGPLCRLRFAHNPRFDMRFGVVDLSKAEFESDHVVKAYEYLRQLPLEFVERPVTRCGLTRTVYLVASSHVAAYRQVSDWFEFDPDVPNLDAALAAFDEWAARPKLHTCTSSGFAVAFGGEYVPHYADYRLAGANAWWDVASNIAFTLDRRIADDLLAAFRNLPLE